MNEININNIEKRVRELEAFLEAAKAEKASLNDPTIKGLNVKVSELGTSHASAIVHLHNAILERLEALTAKVEAIEAKTK